MDQAKFDYDESLWEIEVLSVGVSDAVIFNFVGDCAGRKVYQHKLEPFIKNIGRKVGLLRQVKDNEFIVAYEYNELVYGYDVYHVMVDPYSSSGFGAAILRVLYDLTEVKIFKMGLSSIVLAYNDVMAEMPLIYSVEDRMTLGDWLIGLEEDWCKMVDEICIDTYDDRLAVTSITGHTVGDFEMNFSISLKEGCFADGFRVMPSSDDPLYKEEAKNLEEELLKVIRAKPSCRSSLHKKEIHELVSFEDVDKFIKAECNNLEIAEFYMEHGGFYVAGEKLPVLNPGCSKQTAIWERIAKQKILQANGLVESSTGDLEKSFLGRFFVKDNETGEEYVVRAGCDKDVYFLIDMRRKESRCLPELLSRVYNAYTDTIVSGIAFYDQIRRINNQNTKWEEWAQAEISKIKP